MEDFCRIEVPINSLMNILPLYTNQDFTFCLGERKVHCNKIVADIISPEVANIHRMNTSINSYNVDYQDVDGDMELLLSIFQDNYASIPSHKVNDIFELCLALGNTNLARQLHGFIKKNKGNSNDIIKTNLSQGICKLIPIYIRNVNGGSLKFTIATAKKVFDLKEEIMKKTEISIQKQRLIFEGKDMEDARSLSDYNIKSNSNILLTRIPKICHSSDEFEIYIRPLNGDSFFIKAKPTVTIKNIKERIYQKKNIPTEKQFLISNGIIMDDFLPYIVYNPNLVCYMDIYLATNLNEKLPYKIFTSRNKIFDINMSLTETIYNLKEKIFQKEHVPIKEQVLYLADKMEDYDLMGCIDPRDHIYLKFKSDSSLVKNSFPIIIHTLTGKEMKFNVCSDDTILKIKHEITIREGIPTDQQRIIFHHRQLEDDQKIGEQNIVSGTKLLLILRLRGGKPVIYIYPKEKMDVNVKVNIKGDFTCTYPKYNVDKGWNVNVNENGIMVNKDDPNSIEYDSLFWECLFNDNEFDFNEGFIVTKENAEKFLEDKLYYLGLRGKELTSFIQFWLPQIQRSNYTMIKFLSEEYENVAQLEITPKPDCIIRVFMIMKNLRGDKVEELPLQNLENLHKERNGYTVVEWGGSILYDI